MRGFSLRIEQAIAAGAATTAEIASRLNLPVRPTAIRLCRLAKDGRVCKAGHREQGNSKFPVIVWSVVGRVRELEGA